MTVYRCNGVRCGYDVPFRGMLCEFCAFQVWADIVLAIGGVDVFEMRDCYNCYGSKRRGPYYRRWGLPASAIWEINNAIRAPWGSQFVMEQRARRENARERMRVGESVPF